MIQKHTKCRNTFETRLSEIRDHIYFHILSGIITLRYLHLSFLVSISVAYSCLKFGVFISQRVEPDLQALEGFLGIQGYWPKN